MRTVLIGSDFMYDKNGDLKPIEINTSTGWNNYKIESEDETYDLSGLSTFIQNGGFTKVTYVYQSANKGIITRLDSLLESLNIEFVNLKVGSTSITIPNIEDSDTHLIIRQAYDTTALVDDVYCRDKVNFLNLIKNEDYGSQFAYLNENSELVSNITNIPDNANQPNFILKAVEPHYDKNQYPKFYKVSTQEELDVVLQNVDRDYFLMEFLYNPNKLYNNRIQVIRGLHILYPSSLQGIEIGMYTKLSDDVIIESPSYDTTTFELDITQRNSFLTSDLGIQLPKLLDTDVVQLADGSFKTGLDLQVGDVLKTLDLPVGEYNIAGVAEAASNDNVSFTELQERAVYSTNAVTYKGRVSKTVDYITLTFTDESTWSDTDSSKYLIEDSTLNSILWLPLNQVTPGQIVLLLDTSDETTPVFIKKEIASVQPTSEVFEGWIITVERAHLFLTKTDVASTTSYVAIEHNLACFDPTLCTQDGCPKGQVCCYNSGNNQTACQVGLSQCICN
jgi:hypothetical protein